MSSRSTSRSGSAGSENSSRQNSGSGTSRQNSGSGSGRSNQSPHSSGEERIAHGMRSPHARRSNSPRTINSSNQVRNNSPPTQNQEYPIVDSAEKALRLTKENIEFRLEQHAAHNFWHLIFSSSNLHSLPEWFGNIDPHHQIQSLYLNQNFIETLPESIGNLTNLKVLLIAENNLTKLPESIGRLSRLVSLALNENPITYIPESITKLKNLNLNDETIQILFQCGYFYNPVNHRIAHRTTQSPRPQRQTQNINQSPRRSRSPPRQMNSIQAQNNIPMAQNLQQILRYLQTNTQFIISAEDYDSSSLHLQEEELESLPEWFGDIDPQHKITSLHLNDNSLTKLPESIGNLTHLKFLSLENNQLTELPESIGNLTNLKELDLSDNPITHIPNSITQLRNLYSLNVKTVQILFHCGYIYNPNTEQITRRQDFVFSPPRQRQSQNQTQAQTISVQRPQRTQRQAQRSPERTQQRQLTQQTQRSPKSPEEKYDISCMNEEDTYYLDDFTKGKNEYTQGDRVIILNEGKSKEGTCYGRATLLKQLLLLFDGLPMTGPYPEPTHRFFKLGTQYWVDYNAVKLILEGWKVLRLKRLEDVRIGTTFGISRTHGEMFPIYTLYKPNTKYQGKNEPTILIKMNDGHQVTSEEHVYNTPTTTIIEPVAISATRQRVSFT